MHRLTPLFLAMSVLCGFCCAQATAPAPWLRETADKIGSLVQWRADEPRVLEEGRNRQEVQQSIEATQDFDRTAAMDRALSEAAANGKLVLWYIPRILHADEGFRPGRQMYRPAILDGYARAVFFTDPELSDLINARFVPIRLAVDEALGKRFGIAAPTRVEPALFVLNGAGEVLSSLDRIRSFNASWLWSWLHEGLRDSPASAAELPRAAENWSEVYLEVERASRQGHSSAVDAWLLAESELKDLPPHRSHALALLASAHHRRLGHFDRAADHLQRAAEAEVAIEDAGNKNAAITARTLEGGRLALLQGDLDRAAEAFTTIGRGEARAEAQYRLALCDWFRGKSALAERRLHAAIAAAPNSPYAIRAALNLSDGQDFTPLGPSLHGFEDPFHRPLAKGMSTTAVQRTPDDIERIRKDAVQFLLRMQRDHGGWTDSRYAYWPSPDLTPNVWVATTALCCAALLEARDLDPMAIDRALEKGEAYLMDPAHMARGHQEEVYADTYKLFYLSAKFQRTKDQSARALLTEKAREVVATLALQQETKPTAAGFFGHEYPNGFTTAAVMNGLDLARAMGVRGVHPMMARGAEALLSIRDEDGTYGYAAGRMPRGDLPTRQRNSMARSPISEAALAWADSKAEVRLGESLEEFWTHLPRLEAIRTCDFHTDGELGGFFFWHGILHTIESFKALEPGARATHEARMREFLTKLAEQDGSFVDSHEMGKSYGTAMALLSLFRVLEKAP